MSALLLGWAAWLWVAGPAAVVSATEGPAPAPDDRKDGGWTALFNGRDLSGWETSLAAAGGQEPTAVGRDPKHIFSVVDRDGEPAIRISGEVLGGLATRES